MAKRLLLLLVLVAVATIAFLALHHRGSSNPGQATTTRTTTTAGPTMALKAYFLHDNALVPVVVNVPQTPAVAKAALQALLAGRRRPVTPRRCSRGDEARRHHARGLCGHRVEFSPDAYVAEPERPGSDRRHTDAVSDRPERRDHGGTEPRRALRQRRPATRPGRDRDRLCRPEPGGSDRRPDTGARLDSNEPRARLSGTAVSVRSDLRDRGPGRTASCSAPTRSMPRRERRTAERGRRRSTCHRVQYSSSSTRHRPRTARTCTPPRSS